MSNFDPWPEEAKPIGNAVFAQPFEDQSRLWLKGDLWPRVSGSNETVEVHWGEDLRLIEVVIDFEEGKFGYAFATSGEEGHSSEIWTSPLWSFQYSPYWYPEGVGELKSQALGVDAFDHLSEIENYATWRSLGATWQEMVQSFDTRVQNGEVTLYARVASPLQKSVTPIPPDVWLHFDVVDWPSGVAACRISGERLFSVHARESDRAKAVIVRRAATSADIGALEEEVQRRLDAGEQKMKRPEMVALLRERGVSRDSASEAVNVIPSEHRRQRGERDGIAIKMPGEK